MSKPKCQTCNDNPQGVLGLNSWSPCPACNDLPMSSATKDRAVYDLARILSAPFVKPNNPDTEDKRRLM